MDHLQALNLNKIDVSDLAPLGQLLNLERLCLDGMGVGNLGPLRTLEKLQWLSLNVTRESDLIPFRHLTNLRKLGLFGKEVGDLTPLSTLTNLQLLHFRVEAVSKEQISWLQERLPDTQIIVVQPDPTKSNSTQ